MRSALDRGMLQTQQRSGQLGHLVGVFSGPAGKECVGNTDQQVLFGDGVTEGGSVTK